MRVSINAFPKSFFVIGFAIVLSCAQTSVSHADPLTLAPGDSISASSQSFPLGGTLLSTTTVGFSSSSLSGNLVSSIYSGDTGNSLGGLTFTYEIMLASGSPDGASSISIGNFAGFLTDVSYNSSNSGKAPTTISRDPDGSQIAFNFSSYVLPGANSAFLVIQTDATAFGPGSASVIDDVGTPSILTYAPVPDSPSIWSAFLGLGFLAGVRRFTKWSNVPA